MPAEGGLTGGVGIVYLGEDPLTVAGTFSGQTLSGAVKNDSVTVPLRGPVGGNDVIGAFDGQTDQQLCAGGYIANPAR